MNYVDKNLFDYQGNLKVKIHVFHNEYNDSYYFKINKIYHRRRFGINKSIAPYMLDIQHFHMLLRTCNLSLLKLMMNLICLMNF